jgi:hypothetical protein
VTGPEILEKLERVRVNGPGAWLASCPVPDHGKGRGDTDPSLSIAHRDGRVLFSCMSGCNTQDVLAALDLDWPDLFDEPLTNERGVKVCEWIYQRPDGTPYMIAERWQTPTGKRFVQRLPGADKPGLGRGFKPALYKLPKVLDAARAGEEIWIVEGEKCVSAAERLGLVATTAPAGVNSWRDYYADWLKGASRVNIIADNDEPGMRYAATVAASLKGRDIPVKTWKCAIDRPKADLYDHVLAGYGLENLVSVKLNRLRPLGMNADDLMITEFLPITEVIPGLLPAGLGLLGGAPKVGKSLLALDFAISVARGCPTLADVDTRQGSVLFLSLDNDSMRRTQYRIDKLMHDKHISPGCRLPIEFHTEFPVGDQAIAACIEWANDQKDSGRRPLLIVADTLARIEPNFEGSSYENSYLASTALLARWSRMAEELDLALLAVHHDRKGEDEDWVNRFTGSRGITASAQTLMFVDVPRGQTEGHLRVAGRDLGTLDLRVERKGWTWVTPDGAEVDANKQPTWKPKVVQGGKEQPT